MGIDSSYRRELSSTHGCSIHPTGRRLRQPSSHGKPPEFLPGGLFMSGVWDRVWGYLWRISMAVKPKKSGTPKDETPVEPVEVPKDRPHPTSDEDDWT